MNGMRTTLDAWRKKRLESPAVDSYESRVGFTLIELLVVISIIGILAGLAVNLAPRVKSANQEATTKAIHSDLMTAIESYKAETGNYPPDNSDRTRWPETGDRTNYLMRAGRNPLFYELTGAVFENGKFRLLGKDATVDPAVLSAELGVKGIENSSRSAREVPFKGLPVKASRYKSLRTTGTNEVDIFAVPVKGHFELEARTGGKINPWFYDSSSTNRHNPESFDLWTEYVGRRTNVFGNWKE